MTGKHKVLIVGAEDDLKNDLSGTVLLSRDVSREWVDDIRKARSRISRFKPHLIVIEWPEESILSQTIHALRHRGSGKKAGIVVVSRTLPAETEKRLIDAGANLILPVPVQPGLWNSYLKQLLNVTPRFNTRVGVTVALWSINLSGDRSECRGVSLNLSISGMLIQTRKELQAGAKLDMRFMLPGQDGEINVVGQIMWSMGEDTGTFRSGIQFIVMRNDARRRIAAFIDSILPPPVAGAERVTGARGPEETAEWERELRISEARKMAILDATKEAIVSVDATEHILEFNAAAEAMFGFRRSEDLGKLLSDTLVPEAGREALHRKLRRLITEKENFLETLQSSATARRKDGTEFPAEVSLKPMMVKGRLLLTFFVRDVSDLRQALEDRQEMESRLLQSQKLEAVGTLAGGIAHDFNNIITAIMGYAELSLRSLSDQERMRQYLDNILLSATRARDLAKQLLVFSRTGTDACEPVQVRTILKEVIKLLRVTLPPAIEIRQHIKDPECIISSSPTRIHQVLMNLCTNAAHAMSETGGAIDISLESIVLDGAGAAAYAGLQPGPYAQITVRDSGVGIAEDVMPRIFEPFFTTKANRGTGMGLSVVHGIVKGHGGDIAVESQPGKGSTFRVLLPRIEAPGAGRGAQRPQAEAAVRLLLVDDEKILVDLWREELELLGYRVTGARSGAEALSAFQSEPHAFDLVIADMTMPGMSGDMLIREIRRIRPELPIIICTGYSENITPEQVRELDIRAVIIKPVLIHEMSAVIRETLGPPEPPVVN